MKKSQASSTAQGIAFVRAFESSKPVGERVCYDPLARKLINPAFYLVCKLFAGYAERRGPGVMGYLAARCRYIDDYLQERLEAGIEQLVILGAGLDSRAYRFDQIPGQVKVFEVDHPATQQVKITQIKKIFGSLPQHVCYVPVDFNLETLTKLFDFGYNQQVQTLYIWEGVVHYLTPLAVDQTLAFVVQNSGPGSTIIFDYLYPTALTAPRKRAEISRMERARHLIGEELTFGIPEGEVEEFLRQRGYSQIKNATSDDLHKAYFRGINENRPVAPIYAIVHAAVSE